MNYVLTYSTKTSLVKPEAMSERKIWDTPPEGMIRAYIGKMRKQPSGVSLPIVAICRDANGRTSRHQKRMTITAKSAKNFRLRRVVVEPEQTTEE